jgi:hypothetical protein
VKDFSKYGMWGLVGAVDCWLMSTLVDLMKSRYHDWSLHPVTPEPASWPQYMLILFSVVLVALGAWTHLRGRGAL